MSSLLYWQCLGLRLVQYATGKCQLDPKQINKLQHCGLYMRLGNSHVGTVNLHGGEPHKLTTPPPTRSTSTVAK